MGCVKLQLTSTIVTKDREVGNSHSRILTALTWCLFQTAGTIYCSTK